MRPSICICMCASSFLLTHVRLTQADDDTNITLESRSKHTQSTLEKLEAKLRSKHADIFQMTDTIKTKESETNYKKLALDISQLTEELNNQVIKSLN